jgi:hypothetical protein
MSNFMEKFIIMEDIFALNNPAFWGIMLRFVLNTLCLIVLIRLIYFRYSPKGEYLFSLFLMGIMIFFIGSMLKTVFMELGMAIGLFAVFTILRLRTRSFTMKDMAYVFTTIGLSFINSLKLVGFPVLGVLIINIIIIGSAYLLEEYLLRIQIDTHHIVYDDLELLKPERKQKLMKDLSSKTGREVIRYTVDCVDYKRGIAEIDIYYRDNSASRIRNNEPDAGSKNSDMVPKIKNGDPGSKIKKKDPGSRIKDGEPKA